MLRDMKLLPISSQCLHAWGGPSQVLNQMLDKDIICHILPTSIVLLLCPHCTAEPSCESYTPAFCSKKEEKRKQSRTCKKASHWKYHCRGGTFEGVLELYYTLMIKANEAKTFSGKKTFTSCSDVQYDIFSPFLNLLLCATKAIHNRIRLKQLIKARAR